MRQSARAGDLVESCQPPAFGSYADPPGILGSAAVATGRAAVAPGPEEAAVSDETEEPSEAEQMRQWQRDRLQAQRLHMKRRLEGLEKAREKYREAWKK